MGHPMLPAGPTGAKGKGKCGGSSPFDFAQGQNDKQEERAGVLCFIQCATVIKQPHDLSTPDI